jgi:hypothetical protein
MKLIEDIGIYKSCSYLELLFLFLIAFLTTTTLMVLLPFIPVGIGVVASAMIALALLSVLATFYREKKRNLPERFHIKKLALLFNHFFGIEIHSNNRYSSFSHDVD